MSMHLAFRFDVGHDFRYVIAHVTGGPVHVAVVFGDLAFEAQWAPLDFWRAWRKQPLQGGVRRRDAALMLAHGDWKLKTVPCTPFGEARALFWCNARVGERYNALGALLGWRMGRIAKKWNTHRKFCSQFAVGACEETGDVTFAVKRDGYYHPRRLWDAVQVWS